MAKIEDLIAHIRDERLRAAISLEVRELKKNKKFGLVFEEHLPETVRLPNLQVKEGEMVANKGVSGNELWRVEKIRKGTATLEKIIEDRQPTGVKAVEAPVSELVVVRHFGDPIYPALTPVDRVARGGADKPCHMLIRVQTHNQ
jgi:adenine-specific DNA-methyltransferase